MTGLSGSDTDLDLSTDSGDRPYTGKHPSGGPPAGAEGNDGDLREYGLTLGVDVTTDGELLWLVQEAFLAFLPSSWTEYHDEDGRVYFYNQVTKESSWSHPMDKVFKELIDLVKALRAERPPPTRERKSEAVQAHLQMVHERAMAALDGWSGPYSSDAGTYFYNGALEVSVWDNPVDEWQGELALRQQVLHRCLLSEGLESPTTAALNGRGGGASPSLTEATLSQLPLGLNARNPDEAGPAPVPASPGSARSTRSFLSARSNCTARSITPTRTRSREWPRVPKTSASSVPAPRDEPAQQPTLQLKSAEEVTTPSPSAAQPTDEVPRCSLPDELAQSEQKAEATSSAAQHEASQGSAAPAEVPPAPSRPRSVSPKRPPRPASDATATTPTRRQAGEDDDSDSLEFTFGRTAPVSLPKFGT